jgi:hypothetical protein
VPNLSKEVMMVNELNIEPEKKQQQHVLYHFNLSKSGMIAQDWNNS